MSLALVITGFVCFYLGYMVATILISSRNCLCGDCEEYECDCECNDNEIEE